MRLDEIAIVTRAIGAAFTAAADSLAHSGSPQSVSTPEPARDTPTDNPTPGGTVCAENATELDAFAAGLHAALAQAGLAEPAPPPKKRRKRRLKRHLPDGIGPDWICPELGPMLSQRGVGEALGLSRPHVLDLEARGYLTRHLSQSKVAYCYDQVMELLAKLQRHQSTTQAGATPPTDDGNANDSES